MKRLKKNKSCREKEWMVLVIFLKKRNKVFCKKIRNTLINKNFTMHRKDGSCYIRSSHVRNTHILCDYCCQHSHMKKSVIWKEMWIWKWKLFECWKIQLTPMDPRKIGTKSELSCVGIQEKINPSGTWNIIQNVPWIQKIKELESLKKGWKN